ncbi:MAG TPA: Gfo/Idh/MocA family oxidoreductase [Candidatus Paceibacterota bacterium]
MKKMKKKQLRVGIIGAGLIGAKRAKIIATRPGTRLVTVADPDLDRAKALADAYGVEAMADWKKLVRRPDIDAVVVAVPNAFTAPIVLAALAHKKHVLSEKPFGITAAESKKMLAAARTSRRVVKVGFNHRFHEGLMKAHEIMEKGGIGKVLFLRSRYGHGGRKGMEKEWRFNKKISGGGELLDQGVHIIDLARWFGGEFKEVYGLTQTKYWKAKVDDNAFALMTNDHVTVSFHVSTTNWKNIFSFEVFGDKGYLQIDGKNGSYGEEMLTYGKTNLGFAPTLTVFKFGGKDDSWDREWMNFANAIAGKEKVNGGPLDGLRANQIIEAIYAASKAKKSVRLKR